VQALMNEVLAKQLGRREEGVKEGTVIGKKITASLELSVPPLTSVARLMLAY
jgi:hypothetical protein